MDTPETANLSMWQRSTIGRCCRWLTSWRGIRRLLIITAWTATIIGLVYAEENWRGRRAWTRYRQQLEAQGAELDFKAFIPKEIPAADNFAATPYFEFLFINKTNRPSWNDSIDRAANLIPNPRLDGDRAGRRVVDLVAWEMVLSELHAGQTNRHDRIKSGKYDLISRSNAATAVFEAFKASDSVIEELRSASRRSASRYPIRYDLEDPWSILLPHLARIKSVVQRLQLRACAEVALGRTEEALQDFKLMLRMADSLKEESFLISHLVRIACIQIAMQPLWEGLTDHRWSDAQLQEFQAQLQKYDLLRDAKRSLDGERAGGILTAELLYKRKYTLFTLLDSAEVADHPLGSGFAGLIGRLAPHGWFYFEMVNYCRLFELQIGGTFDLDTQRVFPGRTQSNTHEMERTIAGGRLGKSYKAILEHQVVAALLLPALDKTIRKAATAQITVGQAMIACALERAWLAEGRLPEKLEGLVPRFLAQLPHDLITGKSYRYVPGEGGRFVLYSVGWDEQDNGGVPGKVLFDDTGDWVWENR